MIPVRVRNDPGALQGARHRPRTSGGITNRSTPRSSSRAGSRPSSPAQKLPPLPKEQGKDSGKKKHHPHAKHDAKPLRSSAYKKLHKSEAARDKRCVRHFDKMRQFAYVRNAKITDMFLQYNQNGDDVIDYQEFLLMLNRMSMDKFLSESEMKELFAHADPDGSGGIDINEFNEVFGAQDPLVRKQKKKNMLNQSEKEFREFAENYASEAERRKAIARAGELQTLVSAKLLQKKSASFGNNVRQDGRMYFMAFKQLDRDGDGIVTYDEFKESFGPNGFDLGLSDSDMKDLILSIDQEKTGLIECNTFLKRLRESSAPSDSSPFHEHTPLLRERMKKTVEGLNKVLQDPAALPTEVDGLEPQEQKEDTQLRPEVSKDGPNPFSAAQREASENNVAAKWEKPSEEVLAKRAAFAKQRAHTAKLVRKLRSTPHWKDLSRGGAASFKTVQQQRIAVANQRKAREMGGTFRLSYRARDPNEKVHTYKSKASTPKPHDTFETVGYGRDDSSLFARPDAFDDKAKKYRIRQAKAKRNAGYQARIWNARKQDHLKRIKADAARLRSKIQQREDYLQRAAAQGDHLYKQFIGRKGLYDSEISQRQRFGNMRHYGDKAADWHERYSGGVNIPL